jgi:hypothetical protein
LRFAPSARRTSGRILECAARESGYCGSKSEGAVELNPSVTSYASRNRLLCKPIS